MTRTKKIEDMKKAYIHRDRVVRGLTEDGAFRIAVVRSTKTVQTAQSRHQMSPLVAVLFGRLASGALLLSSFLKGEERITIEAMGNGPAESLFVETIQVGELRGFVRNPFAMLDFSRSDIHLRDALGPGLMRVSKILYNHSEPVTGVVDLKVGDISTDLANYLIQSEQIPSAVVLDVDVDEGGQVIQAGGLLVQVMPDVASQRLDAMQTNIRELANITDLLSSGYHPEEIMKMVADEPITMLRSTPVDFFCRCSIDRFKDALLTLGVEELRDMRAKGQNELVCQYCNEKYLLSPDDFDDLIMQLESNASANGH